MRDDAKHCSRGRLTIILILLWLAWASFFFGSILAALFGVISKTGVQNCFLVSAVILSLTAWIVYALAGRGGRAALFSAMIAVGVTFGTLADLYGGLPSLQFVSDYLVVIIPLFMLGHFAYLTAVFSTWRRMGGKGKKAWWTAITAFMVLGVIAWMSIVTTGEQKQYIVWPTLAYSLVLTATVGSMCGLFFTDRRFFAMACGGLSFLVSDGVLGMIEFHGFSHLLPAVLLTYGCGQMLIVFGAAKTIEFLAGCNDTPVI